MSMPFDRERAAVVLADALIATDKVASRRWGVSERSVKRWRARMVEDEMLAHLVSQKAAEARSKIGDRLDEAILGTVAYLAASVAELPVGDTGAMHIAAGVLKMLTEAKIGVAVVGARTAGEVRSAQPAA